ncbi:MAG: SUMF1/EgtB/PvdO family nonheme iron enzyme [Sedimenticola sp.]
MQALWGHLAPAPRVLRGGSWINNPDNLRSANRNRNTPDNRNNNIGFRVLCRPHHSQPGSGALCRGGPSGPTGPVGLRQCLSSTGDGPRRASGKMAQVGPVRRDDLGHISKRAAPPVLKAWSHPAAVQSPIPDD